MQLKLKSAWKPAKSDKSLCCTVKPVLSCHLKLDKTKVLMENGSLMKIKSTAECSLWSILQYFWPALSDNRQWKPIFDVLLEWPLKTGFTVLSKDGQGTIHPLLFVDSKNSAQSHAVDYILFGSLKCLWVMHKYYCLGKVMYSFFFFFFLTQPKIKQHFWKLEGY